MTGEFVCIHCRVVVALEKAWERSTASWNSKETWLHFPDPDASVGYGRCFDEDWDHFAKPTPAGQKVLI